MVPYPGPGGNTRSSLEVAASHPLFDGRAIIGDSDITRDGRKILVAMPLDVNTANPLTIVTDWAANLRRK